MNGMMGKKAQYQELVSKRKSCSRCEKLCNPADIKNGQFDSERIGPYSRWQGNLNSELVVVAKEFASADKFVHYQGWPGSYKEVSTNGNLATLLKVAGISISPPEIGCSDDQLFFTNAILCLSPGNRMSNRIPRPYFANCVKYFLKPTIDLIQPNAVVTLGKDALDAIRKAYDLDRDRNLTELVQNVSKFPLSLTSEIKLFPMYHPSKQNMRFCYIQKEAWRNLGKYLK